MEKPDGFYSRLKKPPSISVERKTNHHCKNGSTIIESKEFVALLTFGDKDASGRVAYKFRAYSKQDKLEVSGDGAVFERYYRVSDPHSFSDDSSVVDRGSQLTIDAGIFTVEWSLGNYIYLQDGISAVEGSERDYESKIR